MSVEKRFRMLNLGLVVAVALVAALAFAGCGGEPDEETVKEPKTWTLATELPSTGGFSNIAYGKGLFVAATNNKEILWSADGVTWTLVNADYAANMNTGANYVFFGNDEFILATRNATTGEAAKWKTSANGKEWTEVAGPTGGASNLGRAAGGGAYGSGVWALGSSSANVFVFVKAGSGSIETKATGIEDINWVNGVAFGNGKFVITGMGGKIASSSDAATWTDVTPKDSGGENPLFGDGTVNSVVFGNGRFIATGGVSGSQNIAVTSSDGTNWTQTGDTKETSPDNYIYLGFGAGVFITGGSDGSAAYTTDAHNWTLIADTQLTKITGIAYGGGKFVMVGTDATGPAIAYSTPE
jgi:hypothetical protein